MQHAIEGHWRLVAFEEQATDGRWVPAIDAAAHGYIGYWPDGHMQVLIGGGARPRMHGDWAQVPVEQKALCLDQLVAYAGRYSVLSDRVVHHVNTCWIPNWEGRDLVRLVSFPQPGRLLLSTLPVTGARSRPAQRVLWEQLR
jgi:hypothetical protein